MTAWLRDLLADLGDRATFPIIVVTVCAIVIVAAVILG